MGKYSTVSITYVPGDDERESDLDALTEYAEQEIYEEDITGEDVSVAIVQAGAKLMKTMGFADFNSNQNVYIGWERYPSSKPSDFWTNETLLVVIFNAKTRTLKTVVDSWDGTKFNKYDPIVVYWTILPDPPVSL